MKNPSPLLILTLALHLLFSTAPVAVGQTRLVNETSPTFPQRIEKDGVAIEFSIETGKGLTEGNDAVVILSLTDVKTGQPLTGKRPNAWITSRKTETSSNDAECRNRITALLGGLFSARAEADLNSFILLTLNHDNTITFINPLAGVGTTKLEGLVTLPGAGSDWVLGPTGEFVYVTMPEQSTLVVVNTRSRKISETISFPEGSTPQRVFLQPNGRLAWITFKDATIAAIDTTNNKLIAQMPSKPGAKSVAFSSDSKFAFVSSSSANGVSIIDTKTVKAAGEVPIATSAGLISQSSTERIALRRGC